MQEPGATPPESIVVDAYFDGDMVHGGGPYRIAFDNGRISAIEPCDTARPDERRCAFCCPGLAEGHAHLFLSGNALDPDERKRMLDAPFTEKLATARRNLRLSREAGITLVHDAGDAYGVNVAVKSEQEEKGALPRVRTCGIGIHRPGRYGAMIARTVSTPGETDAAAADAARRFDGVKVALTGIVDLATGTVKGAPQFDSDELSRIVEIAHGENTPVHVHASGEAGIAVAVEAGVDSIEHGYFVTRDQLARMRDKRIAWVPTIAPLARYATESPVMRRVVDEHLKSVRTAGELGVNIVAGSDACAPGVPHGRGLIDELIFLIEAGLPVAQSLRAATVVPREVWRIPVPFVRTGALVELTLFNKDPFQDEKHLHSANGVNG